MNKFLSKISGYDRVQYLIDSMPEQDGETFVKRAAEEFKVKTIVHGSIPKKIQSTIFFCTHHTGALDFLATYPQLSGNAKNLKVVANKQLLTINPLSKISIGVNTISTGKVNIVARKKISKHLQEGGNLLLFPAGKVGMLKDGVVTDQEWRSGMADIVQTDARLAVPVFIDSKNGAGFYFIRKYFPKLSMLFLLHSLKIRKKIPVSIYIGKPVETSQFAGLSPTEIMDSIRKLTYQLKEIHDNK